MVLNFSLRVAVLCSGIALWSSPILAASAKVEAFQRFPCQNITGQNIDQIASHNLKADEIQVLTDRINSCFPDQGMRDRYVSELKEVAAQHPDRSAEMQYATRPPTEDDFFKRKQLQQQLNGFKHLPPPLNKSEKNDRLARLENLRQSILSLPVPIRIEIEADLQGVRGDIASSQVQQIEGMSCGVVHNQVQCAPECQIFLGISQPGNLHDYVKRTSGKDLKDWSNTDLDRFHENFITCHANSPREMFAPQITEAAFPRFIDQETDMLRQKRDQLKSGEMEMASLPAECQADLDVLDSKKSTLVNEVPVLGNELDQLFAAGAQDEACQKLQTFTNKLEHIRTSMLTCRDNATVKTSTQYPPTLFLNGAAAFGKMEQTFRGYAQNKGCG